MPILRKFKCNIYEPILMKLYINTNIMKTQFSIKLGRYDLKVHFNVMKGCCDIFYFHTFRPNYNFDSCSYGQLLSFFFAMFEAVIQIHIIQESFGLKKIWK